MEMFEVDVPSATTGDEPVIVETSELGGPGVKTTVPSAFTIGEVIMRVFASAVVEASVQVETPEAFVIEHVP